MFRKIVSIVLVVFVIEAHSGAIIAPSAAIISAKNELAEDAGESSSDSHPQYHFEYAVNDETTGDHKSQYETRDGDVVNGRYTVLEPTGETRQVDYTADAVNGFNAVVTRHSAAKIIAPVVAAPAKIIAQPAIVAPTKLIAQPTYVATPTKLIAQPTYVATPAKFISQPIVASAPASYIATHHTYSAPLVSYHAPATAAIVSHSPLTYHAPAAAIIHH
ncbi:hypothetical protein PVAND_006000 [Polypedilum vanderplanki]|uniref:Cuticle protein n=1 Tax=Polypedilum vanderplanki TaxID=319348 RepID=A0A9J6C3N5_POLVA|nr:hypothetical protein PVAND_006000 [Polypedilum vanderplanki]